MAAAQIFPLVEAATLHATDRFKRRQTVDSVLGTMGAEGELPSAKTLALMEEYVDGRITMAELIDTIFVNARG